MDTCAKIDEYCRHVGYECRVVGVPKTIDNDLPVTDHTPGYGSAAKFIANTLMEISYDNDAYPKGRVNVVEIMGRNAGWLTGAAALSKGEDCEGPDLIYLPELTFDINNFKSRVEKLLKKKTSVVIAVSEGIRTADGNYVCELGKDINFVDSFGHKQLSGTAAYLASFIAGELGAKTRSIELSTLQRAGSHLASAALSPNDPVIVPDLHNPVPFPETVISEGTFLFVRCGRIQGFLEHPVQADCTHTALPGGRKNLDLIRRDPHFLGKSCGAKIPDGLGHGFLGIAAHEEKV